MTASAMPSHLEMCRHASMDDFLAKTFSPQALAHVLTKRLQPTQNGHAAEEQTPVDSALQTASLHAPMFDVNSVAQPL